MKFGQPLLTTELSGSIGGATASSARGSVNYFRVRRRPSNPRSFNQSTVRLIMNSLASAWRNTLTDVQRAAWAAIAPDNSSGIDTYVKVNSQIVLGANTPVLTPLGSGVLAADPFTAIGADASANQLLFTNTTNDDDLFVNCYVTVQKQTSSRLSRQFPYRYVGSVNLPDASAKTLSLAAIYPAAYLTAGDIIYARFVQHNINGSVAVPQEARIVVVA